MLKDFDDCLLTGMVLIDLRKTFDTIKHELLSVKWSVVGFSDHVVKWFWSYLSNCKFIIDLENSFLEISGISYGVPQGSILDHLLLLVYVNNMLMTVKCNLLFYDNDACLVFQKKNVKDIEKQLN